MDGKRVAATEVLKNISRWKRWAPFQFFSFKFKLDFCNGKFWFCKYSPEWNQLLEEINLEKENKEVKIQKRKFHNFVRPDCLRCEAWGCGGPGGGFGSVRLPDSRSGRRLQVGKIFKKSVNMHYDYTFKSGLVLRASRRNSDGKQMKCRYGLFWFGRLVWFPCLVLSCLLWFVCLVWFKQESSGKVMGSKWNVVCGRNLSHKACLSSISPLRKR